MASGSALYNNGDSLGKVDWTRERETFLHLLFARYDLFSRDKDALEEIFQRAYPEFRRCNRDATALYDRWQPRWQKGRKGLNWRQIDRTDERNTYNTNAYTQQELNDFKTLDDVILLWSAHIGRSIRPITGAGPDLTHAVSNPAGILHSLTTTPGNRHTALLPGEQLPAQMRLHLESHPESGGAPIYDFTLKNTIGVDVFPVFGPKKVNQRPKGKQAKKSTKKSAGANKRRARGDSEEDTSDDDNYEPTTRSRTKRRTKQPRNTTRTKQQSPADGESDQYEADVSDEYHDTPAHGTETNSKQPSIAEHITKQDNEPNQPVDDEPWQLPMAHYSSLVFGDTEVSFKPGSTVANSIDPGPDSEAFNFGGYVHIITIDEDAPPEFQAGGRQFALMTVCNTQVCQKCKSEKSEDAAAALPQNHSWDIVYREDILEEDDGTLFFVGRDDDKLPRYTTELPMSAVEREVAFEYDEHTGPNRNAMYKVLVCEDPDEDEVD